jgi:PilZ domain
VSERRCHTRVAVDWAARWRANGPETLAHAADLSLEGARLHLDSAAPHRPGEVAELHLQPEEGAAELRLRGQILRANGPSGRASSMVAIRFLDASLSTRRELANALLRWHHGRAR